VASSRDVEDVMARTSGELGGIHILVNNAGVIRDNLLFKMTEEDWDLAMNVLMSRAAQRHFVAQKYGKIVNVSSISALGNRGQANYSGAKMGVQGFTRTLAVELGPFGICEWGPCLVMRHVDGTVIADDAAADALAPAERRRLAETIIDSMVKLHHVQRAEVGLDNLAVNVPYAPRQLRRWTRQWEQSKPDGAHPPDGLTQRLIRAVRPPRSAASCTATCTPGT